MVFTAVLFLIVRWWLLVRNLGLQYQANITKVCKLLRSLLIFPWVCRRKIYKNVQQHLAIITIKPSLKGLKFSWCQLTFFFTFSFLSTVVSIEFKTQRKIFILQPWTILLLTAFICLNDSKTGKNVISLTSSIK